MLSDLELKRLESRSSLDRHTRTTNDVRVKRKLAAWLKGMGDVLRILDNLPEDQIQDITNDQDIYRLLNIVNYLLYKRNFYPLYGEKDKADDWEVVIDDDITRPAENLDIIRSSELEHYITQLRLFHGLENNPIGAVEFLEMIDNHTDFRDRLTDDDRKSIKRLKQAREEFYKEMD